MVYKDTLNQVGAAIYRKPTSNECYENRQQNDPPLCKNSDDPDAIWYGVLVLVDICSDVYAEWADWVAD